MKKIDEKLKDQMLGLAVMAGVYACITLNRHMQECKHASDNVKKILWFVLSAVIVEGVARIFGIIHIGG